MRSCSSPGAEASKELEDREVRTRGVHNRIGSPPLSVGVVHNA